MVHCGLGLDSTFAPILPLGLAPPILSQLFDAPALTPAIFPLSSPSRNSVGSRSGKDRLINSAALVINSTLVERERVES